MEPTPLSCAHCGDTNLHHYGVLIDQGGAVTRIDGNGARLVRGRELHYVQNHLPGSLRGSNVHSLFACETCDAPSGPPTELTAMSDMFSKGETVRRVTALTDCPLRPKELWRD